MKKRLSFYNENSALTGTGLMLSEELDAYFTAMFEAYIEKGYNLRELTQVINGSVTLVESKQSLEFSEKYNKAKRMELAGRPDLIEQ